MIKVLVVEDSSTVRDLLVSVLNSDENIQVIGTANNGREAVDFVKKTVPDLITMDINMPVMDGYQATAEIMSKRPVPIILISASSNPLEVSTTFLALEKGAMDLIEKPTSPNDPKFAKWKSHLIRTVLATGRLRLKKPRGRQQVSAVLSAPKVRIDSHSRSVKAVAIGASTGGPPALRSILTGLGTDFQHPVLVAQHMSARFMPAFCEWLANSSQMPVRIPDNGAPLEGGVVYVAPDSCFMGLRKSGRFHIQPADENGELCKTVSHLFSSVLDVFGDEVIGVLLTGMGKDGALELKQMKDRGAITIAQDEATSVVYGMPRVAAKLGAAQYMLPIEEIAEAIIRLSGVYQKCV